MKFPNVAKGIKKLYLGEILTLLGVIIGVGLMILLVANGFRLGESGAAFAEKLMDVQVGICIARASLDHNAIESAPARARRYCECLGMVRQRASGESLERKGLALKTDVAEIVFRWTKHRRIAATAAGRRCLGLREEPLKDITVPVGARPDVMRRVGIFPVVRVGSCVPQCAHHAAAAEHGDRTVLATVKRPYSDASQIRRLRDISSAADRNRGGEDVGTTRNGIPCAVAAHREARRVNAVCIDRRIFQKRIQ